MADISTLILDREYKIVNLNISLNERNVNIMGILVADSGGTKTDWAYLEGSDKEYFYGRGLHPAYLTVEQIVENVKDSVPVTPERIYFYGAGCHGSGPESKIDRALSQVFPNADVSVADDLTGAARAHLQQSQGLIASLGTGSICGRYEAGEVQKRSAALGYAIGDEGSAADLGRTILKAYFRDDLNSETLKLTANRLRNVSYTECMDRIYNSDRPNKELAAVAGMVFVHPLTDQLQALLTSRFLGFIDSQFSTLSPDKTEHIVGAGSVAVAHKNILSAAYSKRGFNQISIKQNVIEGLTRYHSLQ